MQNVPVISRVFANRPCIFFCFKIILVSCQSFAIRPSR